MSKVICLNCKSDMYEFYVHHLGNKVFGAWLYVFEY
jgi:hypothetical protein